ncbi:MAG: hypothetical protein ACPG4N_04665 [Gammaproteobacteria bacterium]
MDRADTGMRCMVSGRVQGVWFRGTTAKVDAVDCEMLQEVPAVQGFSIL